MTDRENEDEARSGETARWAVLKFGGTSISSRQKWVTIEKVVRERLDQGFRPLLVCSALSQVSNQLEQVLQQGAEGASPRGALAAMREQHETLAEALGLSATPLLDEDFEQLGRLVQGLALTRDLTPRLRAQVMAFGERWSTRLGAAWLGLQGIATRWYDARDLLAANAIPPTLDSEYRQYLSATCPHEYSEDLDQQLRAVPEPVAMTQGFVARAPDGETALLGRGGSDTSAAYLASRLGAARLEIWSDVRGLFTADPRKVSGAHPLRYLSYEDAVEMATRGAKVLHPRCLEPVREADIPVHLRCTEEPDAPGTEITASTGEEEPTALAISSRRGLLVISMNVAARWQQVGVLAEITDCFRKHGLSIDALASSQTKVTVAVDPAANHLENGVLDRLLEDLARCSEPTIIAPTASVSVIGRGICSLLGRFPSLADQLRREVHLVAHAAHDRSLTFMLDEDQLGAIVEALHHDLLQAQGASAGVPAAAAG